LTDRFVEVGVVVDDDGVLAAEFGDDPLDLLADPAERPRPC
jgi:hypothetical protein